MAEVFYTTLQILLGFAAMTLIIVLIFNAAVNELADTFVLLQDNWMYGAAEILSEFVGIFLFLFIIYDGYVHFDSSLRLGISRTQYFIVSMVLYLLINFLDLLTDGISLALEQDLAISSGIADTLTLENFIGSFAYILAIAIIFYGVYRFGFKFLLVIAGLFLLVTVVGGFGAFAVVESGDINIGLYILRIVEWLEENLFLMKSIGAVLAIVVYYFSIQRIPIQD